MLRVERSDGIEVWTLDRPERLNALNREMLERLNEQAKRLRAELAANLLACRALIVRGAQGAKARAFVAGADIKEMAGLTAAQGEAFSRLGQEAFGALETLPIPTVALIEGFALGGGLELAMGCDFLLSTADAQFGQPESHLGLIPGFGATARLADRVGASRALELLFSGARIDATTALSWGLVSRVLADDARDPELALQAARNFATELTQRASPRAVATLKKIVQGGARERLAQTLENEAREFGRCFESADKREGVAAFLEKRVAQFGAQAWAQE